VGFSLSNVLRRLARDQALRRWIGWATFAIATAIVVVSIGLNESWATASAVLFAVIAARVVLYWWDDPAQ
jgi:hypothetical protein